MSRRLHPPRLLATWNAYAYTLSASPSFPMYTVTRQGQQDRLSQALARTALAAPLTTRLHPHLESLLVVPSRYLVQTCQAVMADNRNRLQQRPAEGPFDPAVGRPDHTYPGPQRRCGL